MKSKYTKTRPQNQLISHGRCVSIALTRSRYFPTRPEYIRFPSRPQQLSESRPVSDRAARSRTPAVGSAAPALVASRVHAALNCEGERLCREGPSRAGSTVSSQGLLRAPGPGGPVSPATEGEIASCSLAGGCLGTQRFSSVVPPHVGARYSTQAYPIFAKSVRPLCVRSMSWSPSWMSEYPRKKTVCGLSLYESRT